ncbi:hypothetical protein DK847_02080 [Aestuariivirga litoralis]|uniref:Methyltransferase FkbM domain-containing protein n=1 Tax=Aestuariivirga litoralis TaxID=2650924 RepID=A0A2W2BSG1_9HYPH|nr:FkbM family methyltransferase [Aestuariivirga litoralis]PZF78617.1 hypothetical protein DK847_02080 [Aestuariivirga litoralis]
MSEQSTAARAIDTRYGQIFIPAGADLISDSLRLYGEWAQNEIDDLLAFIRPGDTVLDVGACFGTHSLAFATQVRPGGRVIAIEAAPETFALLAQTVQASPDAGNITLLNAAATDSAGARFTIRRADGNAGGNQLEPAADGGVPAITLDALDLAAASFIKLDVEGMEAAALRGAAGLLRRARPVVYCELNALAPGLDVMAELLRHDYRCFGHIAPAFNPANRNAHATNIFGDAAECGVLAIAAERVESLAGTMAKRRRLMALGDADDLAALLLQKEQYRRQLMEAFATATAPVAQQVPADPREAAVAREVEAIRPFFDAAFYRARNPDVAESGMPPEEHFCRSGWKEQRDPAPWFSVRHYLGTNPDVAAAGINPFHHYLVSGRQRGLLPRPPDDDARIAAEAAAIRESFDAAYYLACNPDVAASSQPPEEHFCRTGWRERRDPAPWFSVGFYLDTYPDIAAAMVNPFQHYLASGRHRGRLPRALDEPARIAREVKVIAAEFDAAFYLARNPGVAASGLSPEAHFCAIGWRQRRDPAPWFSVSLYLDTYQDIARAGVNPFYHYLLSGRDEGRVGQRPVTPPAALLRKLVPLEQTVSRWRRDGPADLLTAGQLAGLLQERRAAGAGRLMISVSHDDYTSITGGVQHCIQLEQKAAAEDGWLYLNLHPWQPLPRLAHATDDPDPAVSLVLAGEPLGAAPSSAVVAAVRAVAADFTALATVIHQLLGHSAEAIAGLAMAGGETWLWLHDFVTLCPSAHLQRNGIAFCGGPAPGSNACSLCLYGAERARHLPRMTRLFETAALNVVAPSGYVAELWSRRGGFAAASLRVHPHMRLQWQGSAPADAPAPEAVRPLVIAFAGVPSVHKGWLEFCELAAAARAEALPATFLYLGSSAIDAAGVNAISVQVSGDDHDAMIRAMREQQVDVLLHWPAVPETFSFTTHEALAGGALVITNPDSGNVAATVRHTGRGLVLDTPRDLLDALRDGRLLSFVSGFRRERPYETVLVERSRMTLDLVGAGAGQ